MVEPGAGVEVDVLADRVDEPLEARPLLAPIVGPERAEPKARLSRHRLVRLRCARSERTLESRVGEHAAEVLEPAGLERIALEVEP